MLFDKHIEPCCSWCANGVRIGETEVACLKRGIVSAAGSCGRFKYDPLRRDPPVTGPARTEGLRQEDFDL